MKKTILCTELNARLRFIKSNSEKPYNWLFLPGGPGLGSESLCNLTDNLSLPGTMWHLDLPGDGSNITNNDNYYLAHWPAALTEAIRTLDNVILVTHSTGGMYALATPELKKLLYGFVIMDSAPDASWQQSFMEYNNKNPLPNIQLLQKIYINQPNNENLKKLTIASLPYVFTAAGLKKDISFFEHLPYNAKACEWSAQHFDQTYKARWTPDNIPTLIFAGDQDYVTPIDLFIQAKKFLHKNILIRTINNAGHYPWIENFDQVKAVFEEYCRYL